MKQKILLVLFILHPLFSFSQIINKDSLYIVTHYTKTEKQIEMRDGIKLFTAIYLPSDHSEKHPILFVRTPYSCGPYGENKFSDRWWTRGDSVYFYRNYIIAMQDVRGRYMSEGNFEDMRPFIADKKSKTDTDEASDTYDAIEWLIKNVPNNNGNVGVSGISYPGFYATMAALSNHPALKAVSPQAPVTDWFMGDDFHHNGACALMDAFLFYRGFGIPRPKPVTMMPNASEIKSPDNYSYFLGLGTFAEIKKKYLGDTVKFWNDVAAHPDLDAWWSARNTRTDCKNIKPAILITGGLFDAEDCFGGWNLYKAIEKQSPNTNCRLVEGPWIHGGWEKTTGERIGNVWFGNENFPDETKTSLHYWKNFELPFFDYYLKGEGNTETIAEANIFISGENKWYSFQQWPPQNAISTPVYLQENNMLDFQKPVSQNSSDEYISDPAKPVPYTEDVHFTRTREYMTDDQRFASRRPDVLVYTSEILTDDITLTGTVTADLFVNLSTTDADFVVKLIDLFPDDFKWPAAAGAATSYPMGSYQMLIRGEIMRGRYRNSFSKPEGFIPGEITEVKYSLPDIAHTFKKGHRMMIQIQSSWFPLFDRNPQQFINTYTCETKDLVKSTIQIFHDAQHPSNVIVQVLKK